MELDEFDFGLPEAPSSQFSSMNDPEIVSPYSDMGMMENVDGENFNNPFNDLGTDLVPSLGTTDYSAQPQRRSETVNLSEFGFEPPKSNVTGGQPTLVLQKSGMAISKKVFYSSLICTACLNFIAFLVILILIGGVILIKQIEYDVNHLVVNLPEFW